MDSSTREILLMLIPAVVAILGTIPTLIIAIAGYIKVAATARMAKDTKEIAVRNEESLAEVKKNVDGQLTKAWEDAEKWSAQVSELLAHLQTGVFVTGEGAKAVARDLVHTAEVKADALLKAAELVAANLIDTARIVAKKVGPDGVKVAALEAVGEAVGEAVNKEISKVLQNKEIDPEGVEPKHVAEVRRLDEH